MKPYHKKYRKPELKLQTTTLWEYPSQHYGDTTQGDPNYTGATPSYVIWNLLERYTKKGDLVCDPMCGSGTTIDVCKDLEREVLGFDLAPYRKDITQADARKLPVNSDSIDFVFVDPPYSNHLKYSGKKGCIGELDARESDEYFAAMTDVIAEINRILKPGHYMGLYIQDSYKKGKEFIPLGFEIFAKLAYFFEPMDVISVVRNHKTLKRRHWHSSAIEGNYFLRGFNYLFIMRKPQIESPGSKKRKSQKARKK